MKKVIKGVFLTMFLLFCVVFFNRGNNTYENENVIKEEAIIQFEKDLKEGKEIVPSEYLIPEKDYQNKASSLGIKTSHLIEKVFKKGLKFLVRYLDE